MQFEMFQPNGQPVDYELSRKDLGYKYPNDLDLRPTSELHHKLVQAVLHDTEASRITMSQRYSKANKMDEVFTSYIPLSEEERLLNNQDPRRPVSIIVPASFANKEAILTHLSSIFFEGFIYPITSASPDDIVGAIKFQHALQHQAMWAKHELDIYVQMDDALKYGMGIIVPNWHREVTVEDFYDAVYEPDPATGEDVAIGSTLRQQEKVTFEGHVLQTIDIYRYFPDPNYPPHKIQQCEFINWVETCNRFDLLTEEKYGAAQWFNMRYLPAYHNRSVFASDDSGRNRGTGFESRETNTQSFNVDIVNSYKKLIPAEWGLGPSEMPQKWLISVANDSLIVRARPIGLKHSRFPIAVSAPDFDGYSVWPISRMETVYGLQQAIDFYHNSRMEAVRKAINDVFLVDPWRVNMPDLEQPGPKYVRLRKPAYGQGVEGAMKQMNVNDVTARHPEDMTIIEDMMNRGTGAVDIIQGVMRTSGERRSAEEARNARISAQSRLNMLARKIGLMSMQDLTYLIASQTKQYMSQELWVRLQGGLDQQLIQEYGISEQDIRHGRLRVTPDDIDVNFDIYSVPMKRPTGEYAETWVQLMGMIQSNPLLMSRISSVRVFLHIARLLDAKDAHEFLMKPGEMPMLPPVEQKVVPDDEAREMNERGTVRPIPS